MTVYCGAVKFTSLNKIARFFLQKLYDGHPGSSWMKALARMYMWWFSMDKYIDQLVSEVYQLVSEVCSTNAIQSPSIGQQTSDPCTCRSSWCNAREDVSCPY